MSCVRRVRRGGSEPLMVFMSFMGGCGNGCCRGCTYNICTIQSEQRLGEKNEL